MKDEMIHAGYKWDPDGKVWISPYSGMATSFQPAREEFMLVRNLKPEAMAKLAKLQHADDIELLQNQKENAEKRSRRLFDLANKRERQVNRLLHSMRSIRDSLVSWKDAETSGLLELIGNVATRAVNETEDELAKGVQKEGWSGDIFPIHSNTPPVGSPEWWERMQQPMGINEDEWT